MSTLEIILSISATCAVFIAIAAVWTLYRNGTVQAKESKSKRPYFTVINPGIKQLQQSPPFNLVINLKNIGVNPAINFEAIILIIPQDFSSPPVFSTEFSVANDIPRDAIANYHNDSVQLPNNLPPHHIVLAIKYLDPLLNTDYAQRYYMNWEGVQNGLVKGNFVHADMNQRNSINNFLEAELRNFPV